MRASNGMEINSFTEYTYIYIWSGTKLNRVTVSWQAINAYKSPCKSLEYSHVHIENRNRPRGIQPLIRMDPRCHQKKTLINRMRIDAFQNYNDNSPTIMHRRRTLQFN